MEYLIEQLTAKLLQRTYDGVDDVRIAAYGSLNRLQNYRDPHDEVSRLPRSCMD